MNHLPAAPFDDGMNDLLPVITCATNPTDPEPEWAAAVANTPIPDRGSGVTPSWFEFRENGWSCEYPHPDPNAACGVGRLPASRVASSALYHLNRFHPGWKLPCRSCGRPQWNADGSLRCFGCRP